MLIIIESIKIEYELDSCYVLSVLTMFAVRDYSNKTFAY